MELKPITLVAVCLLFIVSLSTLSIALKVNYAGSLTETEKAVYNATILELNQSIDLHNIKEINILNNCYLKEDDNKNMFCSDAKAKAYNHFNGNVGEYKINIFSARYLIENNLTTFVLLHEIRHTQQYSLNFEQTTKLFSSWWSNLDNKDKSATDIAQIDADNYAYGMLAFQRIDKLRKLYG